MLEIFRINYFTGYGEHYIWFEEIDIQQIFGLIAGLV